MLDPEGVSPNAIFVMNVLDTLNNQDDISVMRSKVQGFNPLDDSEPSVRRIVKTFNILGLPVLVIIFGFGVFLTRKSKRRRIQLMFQK